MNRPTSRTESSRLRTRGVRFLVLVSALSMVIPAVARGATSMQDRWMLMDFMNQLAKKHNKGIEVDEYVPANSTVTVYFTSNGERLKNPGEEISFRQSSFWYHRGNTVYNIQEADKKSKTLYGVSVFELDQNGRLIRSIRAKQVEVGDDLRNQLWWAIWCSLTSQSPAPLQARQIT